MTTVLTRLNTAVLTPMPSASVRMEIARTPALGRAVGRRARCLIATRTPPVEPSPVGVVWTARGTVWLKPTGPARCPYQTMFHPPGGPPGAQWWAYFVRQRLGPRWTRRHDVAAED